MSEELLIKDEAEENETEKAVEEASEDTAPAEIKDEHPIVFEEALEAILFAAGHPISYATLARVFEMTPGKVKDKVFEYSLKYNDPNIPRGVILLTFPDSCQLSTKQYYLNEIREALGLKRNGTLSTSSMEALAIVAYNQPVTRYFVDTLRRADSSYAMNNLIDRGLIESKGRLDAPGRPMLYGTTPDFLRAFGINSIEELPKTTEEIQAVFATTSNTEEKEEVTEEQEVVQTTFDDLENKPETAENAESDVLEFEPSAEDYQSIDESGDGEEDERSEDEGELLASKEESAEE